MEDYNESYAGWLKVRQDLRLELADTSYIVWRSDTKTYTLYYPDKPKRELGDHVNWVVNEYLQQHSPKPPAL